MVNTVILGDCLYKKSNIISTLQNYCFSGIYASTQNSHFKRYSRSNQIATNRSYMI